MNYNGIMHKINKPLLVIVCGRPGSGKTTLAHGLSQKIRCPIISRDELKEGYVNTVQKEHSGLANEEVINVNNGFFNVLKLMADHRISCIAESAFQDKLWAPQYEALSQRANIILVMCKADSVISNKRYLERKRDDPSREYFHGDSSVKTENDVYEYIPPRFPVPVLEVDTTNGYEPGMEEIIAFIKEQRR